MKTGLVVAGDMRHLFRDRMLLVVLAIPVLVAGMVRFGFTPLAELLLVSAGVDIIPYRPLVAVCILLVAPLTVGTLAGFLILGDREQRILDYVAVTPLSRTQYLGSRLAVNTLLTAVLSVVSLQLSGLWDPAQGLLPAVVMSAVETPLAAMLIGTFATNRVEGLAVSKLMGAVMAGPVVAFVSRSPWALVAGVLPPYWVARAMWADGWGELAAVTVVGMGVHAVAFWLLSRRFDRVTAVG